MDPNTQNSFIVGNDAGQQPQKRRWPFSRRATIIIGVVLAVIIIGIAMLLSSSSQPKKTTTTNPEQDKTLYIKRPGYAFDSSVGDPTALTQVNTNQVVQYGGAPVVQACSILQIKDMNALGLKLTPNPESSALKRTYFDGKGAGQVVIGSDLGLPFDEDSNSCLYYFGTNRDNVSVDIFQSTYANLDALDGQQHRNYDLLPAMHGLQVYKQQPIKDYSGKTLDSVTYIIRGPTASATLLVDSKDTDVQSKLLERVTTNLAAAQTTPTPLLRFQINSPVFTGATLQPCDLLDNAAFKSAFGVDASPLVAEWTSTVVGVLSQSNTKDNKYVNYVDGYCMRHTTAETYLDVPNFQVFTTTFETEDGAKNQMAFDRSQSPYSKNIQATPSIVGDDSFYGDVSSANHAIEFRKGRVVVVATYGTPNHDTGISDAQRMQTLMPAVQYMVAHNMQGF